MFMPWDERVEIGDSDERHVLFNSRDMPCLIFLGAQHLVLVGWNSPLHRDRRTREPPVVPILFVALLGIAANVVTATSDLGR